MKTSVSCEYAIDEYTELKVAFQSCRTVKSTGKIIENFRHPVTPKFSVKITCSVNLSLKYFL